MVVNCLQINIRGISMNNKNIDDQFLKCIEEWSKEELDARLEKALDVYDEWVKHFQDEEKILIANLLENYNYYTYGKIQQILKRLHEQIVVQYGISSENSVISVIRKKDGRFCSSWKYWISYMDISGLSNDVFYDSLNDIDDKYWENISNVVFVDDCSGSGETVTKFLDRQNKDFSNKHIFIVIIEMLEEAKIHIKRYAEEKKLNIVPIPYIIKCKAFEGEDRKTRQRFCMMSHRINVQNKYIWGFKQTEALMAFYNNTPNNSLGIFWYSSEGYEPIFPRRFDDKAGWKDLSKAKKNRQNQQYKSKSGY